MNTTRVARNSSAVAVATIAAWSSWSHMVHVALRFGERPEVAYVLPISVDGMLIVASAVMVDDKRAGRNVRWSARIAFIVGVAASVAANIAAAHPTAGARVVAGWPAVALLLVVEMLSRSGRTTDPRSRTHRTGQHVRPPRDARRVRPFGRGGFRAGPRAGRRARPQWPWRKSAGSWPQPCSDLKNERMVPRASCPGHRRQVQVPVYVRQFVRLQGGKWVVVTDDWVRLPA